MSAAARAINVLEAIETCRAGYDRLLSWPRREPLSEYVRNLIVVSWLLFLGSVQHLLTVSLALLTNYAL
jgi:hypothetical protein